MASWDQKWFVVTSRGLPWSVSSLSGSSGSPCVDGWVSRVAAPLILERPAQLSARPPLGSLGIVAVAAALALLRRTERRDFAVAPLIVRPHDSIKKILCSSHLQRLLLLQDDPICDGRWSLNMRGTYATSNIGLITEEDCRVNLRFHFVFSVKL
jgi:hypothetical protein